MPQPTSISEVMYSDGTVVDSTRTTQAGIATTYWVSRNLPATGQAALDSTIDLNNCEVRQFFFGGHTTGNYVTNFKYYISDENAISSDMTHMFYTSATFTDPSSYSDADIYNMTGDWTTAPTSAPAAPNVSTYTGFLETDDPTVTNFVYSAVIVEAGKTTGTASWKTKLLYQYT